MYNPKTTTTAPQQGNQQPQQPLPSVPAFRPPYEPDRWKNSEVNCYVYILNWPEAHKENVFDAGDLYAQYVRFNEDARETQSGHGYLGYKMKKTGLTGRAEKLAQRIEPADGAVVTNLGARVKLAFQHLSVEEQKQLVADMKVLAQNYLRLVRNSAQRDGLIPMKTLEVPAGYYVVAVFIDPDPDGLDHHWYRWDSNGYWSHKPGEEAVRNVDNNNQVITNPHTANRGAWTIFGGYFLVPQGPRHAQ